MKKLKNFKCHECGKVHSMTQKQKNRKTRDRKDKKFFCDFNCYSQNRFKKFRVKAKCVCCGKEKTLSKSVYEKALGVNGRYVCSRKCYYIDLASKKNLNLCQRRGCNHQATNVIGAKSNRPVRLCPFHYSEYRKQSAMTQTQWNKANPDRRKEIEARHEEKKVKNTYSIIANLVPDYMKNYKLREEMGRTIWLSLFEKHGIFCYNELFLGERAKVNRPSITADLYIPSIKLLIEAKRNNQTTTLKLTCDQLEGYLDLFEERFGFTPDTWDYSIDGSGANNNFYDTAIELEKRILKAVKKKKLIIRSIRDFKKDMNKIKKECIMNRDCFEGGLSI